mmetsp:Transcript_4830/g.7325  ORF Transcript_4830/g.7325 Transcript_4830/m.7325 type:complete len:305 (+) Transcript_4830:85-999(+)
MPPQRPLLTPLLITTLLAYTIHSLSNDEAFDATDLNRDGVIDRNEFLIFTERLYGDISNVVGNRGDYVGPEYYIPSILGIGPGFKGGFISGVGMIIATEIGDKTFFIAAIMAMQYSRLVVFSGAISALTVMTILSAALGFALPNFLPREYTHYAGAILFLYFGIRMLKEGLDAETEGPSEELAEVEQELTGKKSESAEIENGGVQPTSKIERNNKNLLKVFTQAFSLTFLAEWGDRSQIATIALAAAKDYVGVTLGGIVGHSFCTGMAVLGGRLLAARISEKTVHLFGGALFLLFGLHSLLFGL